MSLLFKVSYGLYMVSATYQGDTSGCIINTLSQQTAVPERVTITVDKKNFTHNLIEKSKKCVVNILSEDTDFEFIKTFGMTSGRDEDKFLDVPTLSTTDGTPTNKANTVGYLELSVEQTIDFGTHTMFVCEITKEKELKGSNPLTYAYYHEKVKPQPTKNQTEEEVWVCKICNFEYVGTLSEDYICPLCKHGIKDFVRK